MTNRSLMEKFAHKIEQIALKNGGIAHKIIKVAPRIIKQIAQEKILGLIFNLFF